MRATIKLKLGVTFVMVIALSAASAVLAISGLGSLRDSVDNLVDGAAQEVSLSKEMSTDVEALVVAEKNMITANNQTEVQTFDAQIQDLRGQVVDDQSKLNAVTHDESKQKLAAFQTTWQQMLPVQDKIRQLMTNMDGRDQAETLSETQERDLVKQAEEQLQGIVGQAEAFMQQSKKDAEDDYSYDRTLLLAAVIVSLLVAAGAGIWISTLISRGLSRAGSLTQAVADGDLTRTIEKVPNDEIGDLIGNVNRMVVQLRGVVSEASSASDNVSAGSQELSSSAEELSQGATEQASAAEEASSSMEEMASNIKQNADNATQTEKIARQSSADAQASGEAVGRAVEAM
ncbi:MAG TPA: methyl-accepting chemotaxis protein, partial [Dongiaceae bacterium]|nr:methyl-accepting chemotaxis protein [Dongiaceae bacterium]